MLHTTAELEDQRRPLVARRTVEPVLVDKPGQLEEPSAERVRKPLELRAVPMRARPLVPSELVLLEPEQTAARSWVLPVLRRLEQQPKLVVLEQTAVREQELQPLRMAAVRRLELARGRTIAARRLERAQERTARAQQMLVRGPQQTELALPGQRLEERARQESSNSARPRLHCRRSRTMRARLEVPPERRTRALQVARRRARRQKAPGLAAELAGPELQPLVDRPAAAHWEQVPVEAEPRWAVAVERTEVAEPAAEAPAVAVADTAEEQVAARIEVPEQTGAAAARTAEVRAAEPVRIAAAAVVPRTEAEVAVRMLEQAPELAVSVRPAGLRWLGAIHSEDMRRQLPPVAPTNGPGNCHKRLQT